MKIGGTLTPLGWVSIQGFQAPAMRIGTLVVRPTARVPCVDLQWLSDGIGEDVDGLLGIDVLRDLVFSIDFDEGKLRFHRAAQADFGRQVPLIFHGVPGRERPFVAGILSGDMPRNFLIDTGGISNVSATLAKPVFDELLESGILAPIAPAAPNWTPAKVITLTGGIDVSFARAEWLSVAGQKHERALFSAHPRVSALGLCFLSRYFVAFDFPNTVMYVRPGKGFRRPDVWYDLTSFAVSSRDGQVVVRSPREDGWGARAGVQQGDLIIAINGRETKGLSLFAIRRMLAVENRQVLDVRRGGEALRIVLDMTSQIQEVFGENSAGSSASNDAQLKAAMRRASPQAEGGDDARSERSDCVGRRDR